MDDEDVGAFAEDELEHAELVGLAAPAGFARTARDPTDAADAQAVEGHDVAVQQVDAWPGYEARLLARASEAIVVAGDPRDPAERRRERFPDRDQSSIFVARDDVSACGTGPESTIWSVAKGQPGSATKIAAGGRVESIAVTSGRAYWLDRCTGTLNATTTQGDTSVVWSKNELQGQTHVATWGKIVYWRFGSELYRLVE